jgi:hypothetical protein
VAVCKKSNKIIKNMSLKNFLSKIKCVNFPFLLKWLWFGLLYRIKKYTILLVVYYFEILSIFFGENEINYDDEIKERQYKKRSNLNKYQNKLDSKKCNDELQSEVRKILNDSNSTEKSSFLTKCLNILKKIKLSFKFLIGLPRTFYFIINLVFLKIY